MVQNMETKRALGLLLLAGAFFCPNPLMAATQGTLGATSSASSVVSLAIDNLFRISDTIDMDLGTYSGAGNMTADHDICVYTNGSGSYSLTITSDATMPGGEFAVEDVTQTHQLPMEVRWNSGTGIAGNTAVSYGTPLSGTGANTTSSDCSVAGKSANLQVNFLEAYLQTASATGYSSTLTLMVEP
jgi:hypothetical protein